jgi:hypothetical protein
LREFPKEWNDARHASAALIIGEEPGKSLPGNRVSGRVRRLVGNFLLHLILVDVALDFGWGGAFRAAVTALLGTRLSPLR